ncbi:MAG: HAD-IC family P-type ATPase [Thermoleophilaceae bacterium]
MARANNPIADRIAERAADEPLAQAPSHALAPDAALELQGTDRARGLTQDEARLRLERLGPNELPEQRRPGPLLRFAFQFHHPLIYILLAASAITLAIGEVVDSGVIFAVVLVNAAVGFIQESRAERAMEALATMLTVTVCVVRDGERQRLPSQELVPGDLLVIEAGDMVGADARLVEQRELEVDESALTGESVPARKAVEELPADTGVGDRANMAFSGTLVSRGYGIGVVVATGAATEVGRIHQLMGEAVEIATPLTRKITRFAKALTVAILALAVVTYVAGVSRGEDSHEIFLAAVALAVGAIPEGLPAAITITLAIGVYRMARRHAIVRKPPAVEALGSTTVVCSDKTGTLTANEMTVKAIVAGGARYDVSGTGYALDGAISGDGRPLASAESVALRECLLAGALCNDSRLAQRSGEGRGLEVVGDPTEAALLVSAHKGGLDPDASRRERERLSAIPFESERRFMATLHAEPRSRSTTVYVKGAVESVLGMCAHALAADGGTARLDSVAVEREAEALASDGLRVLALARGSMPVGAELEPEAPPRDIVFVGLQAMMDPPRAEAIEAVAACRRAGVAVKMITGDHAATAAAISELIGLAGEAPDGAPHVVTGADIAACPPERLAEAAEDSSVFARVSPEQKLRLVEALQQKGHIVAMTGDGVNDAPALKRADIGVAMGRTGTEVAREASDIVLTDDNFASIRAAVEEGRRIFDNLTKFIVWTLPTNMGEGMLILTAIVIGAALPILPVQILWINMTTAVTLGLMLAFERHEPGVMSRPPRDPGRPILTAELVGRMLLVSSVLLAGSYGLFEWQLSRGASLDEARTVAVNVFVAGELFYLFNCRSLTGSILSIGPVSNRPLLIGVATMIALQAVFTYAPPMHSVLHSSPIEAAAWLPVVAVGVVVSAVVGLEKRIRTRRKTSHA